MMSSLNRTERLLFQIVLRHCEHLVAVQNYSQTVVLANLKSLA